MGSPGKLLFQNPGVEDFTESFDWAHKGTVELYPLSGFVPCPLGLLSISRWSQALMSKGTFTSGGRRGPL